MRRWFHRRGMYPMRAGARLTALALFCRVPPVRVHSHDSVTEVFLIALRHVTVVRDPGRGATRPALDDVSILIGAGEHVCILGPNGCGKSTLIKTITRECYPLAREGSSVRILGRERWNVFELRERLGIVTPDLLPACSTDATARDVFCSCFFSSTRIFR